MKLTFFLFVLLKHALTHHGTIQEYHSSLSICPQPFSTSSGGSKLNIKKVSTVSFGF